MREVPLNIPPFKKLILLKEVSSTMDIAYKLGKLGERYVVIEAEKQSFGRGKGKRIWFSDHSSLLFSILLRGDLFYKPSLLSILASVIVKRGIVSLSGIPIKLKWPNDIIFNGKKLGGILGEDWGKFVIIGIGINVNEENFPPWLDMAISLYQITGREISKDDLLISILKEFSLSFEAFVNGSDILIKEWKKSCNILGERVKIKQGTSNKEGIIVDIAPDGALIVEAIDGRRRKIYSTEELILEGGENGERIPKTF
jgi:BirA family biotin operon repressor/biotin-[acetyl-CoA-carboxylase] ligase